MATVLKTKVICQNCEVNGRGEERKKKGRKEGKVLADVVSAARNNNISLGDSGPDVLIKGGLHKSRVLLNYTVHITLANRNIPFHCVFRKSKTERKKKRKEKVQTSSCQPDIVVGVYKDPHIHEV
jgi:hypothetical protein